MKFLYKSTRESVCLPFRHAFEYIYELLQLADLAKWCVRLNCRDEV